MYKRQGEGGAAGGGVGWGGEAGYAEGVCAYLGGGGGWQGAGGWKHGLYLSWLSCMVVMMARFAWEGHIMDGGIQV